MAFVSHNSIGLQRLLSSWITSDAYSHDDLVIDINKTEILQQTCVPDTNPCSFHVEDVTIVNVNKFIYLISDLQEHLWCDIQYSVLYSFCLCCVCSTKYSCTSQQKHQHQNRSVCLQYCLSFSPAIWLQVLGALPVSYQDASKVLYLLPPTNTWLTLVGQNPSCWDTWLNKLPAIGGNNL